MTVEDLEEVFEYLDGLRESGATNMFGAAAYIREEFGYSKAESNALNIAWMETFDGETDAADRAASKIDNFN